MVKTISGHSKKDIYGSIEEFGRAVLLYIPLHEYKDGSSIL